jgi:exopolysaccharide biosynthesis polyprenyl glycosylphosphotransferase
MAAPDFVTQNYYAETVAPVRKESQATSREQFKNSLAFAETVADFVTCTLGILASYFLCTCLGFGPEFEHPLRQVIALGTVLGLLVIFLQRRDGAYRMDGGLLQIRETERAIRIPAESLTLLLIISWALKLNSSWLIFLIAAVVIPILLIVQKQWLFAVVRGLQQCEGGADRVIVYGAGATGRNVVSTLLHSPRLGLLPVGVIEDCPSRNVGRMLVMGYRNRGSVPVRPGPLTPALLSSLQADLLLLAAQNLSPEQLSAATYAAKQAGLDVAVLSGSAVQDPQLADSFDIDGLHFASLKERPEAWPYTVAKRIADLVLSSVLLVVFAPFLFLIAMLIRFDSPGPALFVQKRVGRNGTIFDMYKFRSMYTLTPKYDLSPTTSKDPRITRIGRILRRASLDELPQLINVFWGNMSLVGPRPEMPFIVERYNDQQRKRLEVTPGITGLWQLSADRAFPIHQNLQYDFYYIRNRNFAMDAAILVHTLFFAMSGGI